MAALWRCSGDGDEGRSNGASLGVDGHAAGGHGDQGGCYIQSLHANTAHQEEALHDLTCTLEQLQQSCWTKLTLIQHLDCSIGALRQVQAVAASGSA
jgi:hypothetical protein